MRLRYLKITNLPPLEDVEIEFQHETLLGRECSIRFVVGVNGSGKSRLLRALTEVFVQLEQAIELNLPFPITLAYDVGRGETSHSVYLHYPGEREGSRFAIFSEVLAEDTDWTSIDIESLPDDQLYKDGDLPGTSALVANTPRVLIAYTSGNPSLWQAIFDIPQRDLDIVLEEETEERPQGWTVQDELLYQVGEDPKSVSDEQRELDDSSSQGSRIGYLVTTDNLKLAVLSVSIQETIDVLQKNPLPEDKEAFVQRIRDAKLNNQTMRGLRGLLNEVDWLWPITVGLEIDFDTESLALRRNRTQLRQLYQASTSVVKQPEPSTTRLLLFDLQRPALQDDTTLVNGNPLTINKLAEAIAGETYSAFDIYRNLHQLHQQGILKAVQIAVQKTNLQDVLMYDWLSDGEQEFLGRMALFHLLKDQDDALVILDEPETHFNDVWKRRIVDIIDDSLRDNVSEVVISTHSSIALTDVFETEITLLRKRDSDATVAVVYQPFKTFGALPSEIMTEVFKAPEVIGQRAMEFLDLILMSISYPDDIESVWNLEASTDVLQDNTSLQRLYTHLLELPHHYGDEIESKKRIIKTFKSLRVFTQKVSDRDDVSVADMVQTLRQRLGQGHYEFEFRRRLRALQRD